MKKFLTLALALVLVIGCVANASALTIGFSQVGQESDWRTANTDRVNDTFKRIALSFCFAFFKHAAAHRTALFIRRAFAAIGRTAKRIFGMGSHHCHYGRSNNCDPAGLYSKEKRAQKIIALKVSVQINTTEIYRTKITVFPNKL